MIRFFEKLRAIDLQLQAAIDRLVVSFEKPDSLHKKLSAFYASKNTQYFKQIQKYLSPTSTGNIFFGSLAATQHES